MNGDQLHRSTLAIYSNLTDDFNPSIQKLVSLGDGYVHAFKALAVRSEAYFNALLKIGEKALHTESSRSLGGVLIQISANQKRLTAELDGLFRWFSGEVLQKLDNNTRLDRDYISDSRDQYEMEVHNQTAGLGRYPRRGGNQDSEFVQFLRESHAAALTEEERRYRFLAEKHCGLIQSLADLMNKLGVSLQQKADDWAEEVGATRQLEDRRPSAVDNTFAMRSEDVRQIREELPLGKIPSRAPSPQGSISHAKGESVGGGAGGRSTRALVAHQPAASNPTLLPFSKGEMITLLVQQARNGWMFGRAERSSRQGWFPASYVEAVDDAPKSISSSFSSPSLRASSSSSSSSNMGGAAPPPPPPPPPSSSSSPSLSSLSSYESSGRQAVPPTPDRRAESNSEIKRSQPHGSQPELFPRGTNPFATVKLKPTHTNDRSAPHVRR
ncbi:brain-specific angioproteinsis inhibitor 1-associated 2 2 [Solea senegalensis]|uniref:Brain-specific angioproteinsis inhibitor 1-associated 2 2 n=1 Tax=Solea senegalensis TaxID=28829 RepID=A0AAV6RP70_SOLSE|nr:brain-specific angiogenesis inhibitor 1-associated protein 2-like protein 2 [Solea senegalensis]KAG7505666.1 brain-specific angioproteinsis inhibitor 1-associated 2 2 [Solea senegalensis]